MRAFLIAMAIVLLCGTAHSATDVFMRAVGFALTGSDDAEPQAIDRANCVFAYKNDVFHLIMSTRTGLKLKAGRTKEETSGSMSICTAMTLWSSTRLNQ